MKPTIITPGAARWVRIGLGCCLLFILSLALIYSQQPQQLLEKKKDEVVIHGMIPRQNAPPALAKLPVEPGAMEVAFTDGSNLKLLLREEKIALATPHGKLHIAVADIQRIEFATRVSDEDAKRIKAAIADLGSGDFDKREAASAQLRKLREKAYPDLQRAAGQNDPEVVRRARELVQHITSSVPPDRLTVRPKDVIYTSDSMIAGRIEGVSLKAHTAQFGAVQVKLADVRSLHSQGMQMVLPAPAGVGLDAMIQQNQWEIQRRRIQGQMPIMPRPMNKVWEKK